MQGILETIEIVVLSLLTNVRSVIRDPILVQNTYLHLNFHFIRYL